tara:strand:- start:7 stop:237 length:231 start_codon:yes stop_codon:yes gene_type:complete
LSERENKVTAFCNAAPGPWLLTPGPPSWFHYFQLGAVNKQQQAAAGSRQRQQQAAGRGSNRQQAAATSSRQKLSRE